MQTRWGPLEVAVGVAAEVAEVHVEEALVAAVAVVVARTVVADREVAVVELHRLVVASGVVHAAVQVTNAKPATNVRGLLPRKSPRSLLTAHLQTICL